MENKRNDEIDLLELFFALLHRIWVIIIAAIAGAVIAVLYTVLAVTPMYSSTSMIYILGDSMDVSSIINMQIGSALTTDYQIIVKSRPVVEKVISDLELDVSYETLCNSIEVSSTEDSHILKLKVNNSDPYMAKVIVDDLTQVVIQQTADVMESAEPNIIQKGELAENPDSPSLKKNTVMGGLVGLILAVAVITVIFLADDRIKNQTDVERYLELSTIGVIPLEEGTTKQKRKRLDIRQRLRGRRRKNGN